MAKPLPFPAPAADPDDAPIPDWHLQIVEERLAAHRAQPEQVVPWDEAEAEILARLQQRPSAR